MKAKPHGSIVDYSPDDDGSLVATIECWSCGAEMRVAEWMREDPECHCGWYWSIELSVLPYRRTPTDSEEDESNRDRLNECVFPDEYKTHRTPNTDPGEEARDD